MKKIVLLLILMASNSFACTLKQERTSDPFWHLMINSENMAIAKVVRVYWREDKCSNEAKCSENGVVFKVEKILKGKLPPFIEAHKAMYSSCDDHIFHPYANVEDLQNIEFPSSSYEVGSEYLIVLEKEPNDFMLLAGKPLKESLLLLDKYRKEAPSN